MSGARRGFTITELTLAVMLLMLFVIMAGVELRAVIRSSAATSTAALELTLAARAAEEFRDDVRRATSAVVAHDGSSVQLRTRTGVFDYSQAGDGRLRRAETNGAAAAKPAAGATGPLVCALYFQLETPAVLGRSMQVLRARWVCASGVAPGKVHGQADVLPGRTLVLDTALRVQGKEAGTP